MTSNVQHPIAAIISAKGKLEYKTKSIALGIRPHQFEDICTELESRLRQFNFLTDAAIEAHNLTDDVEIKQIKDDAKRFIIKSSFTNDFNEKYSPEMKWHKSSEDLLKYIKDMIGVETPIQKSKAARKLLKESTRQVESNEKYEQFLTRLTRVANNITADEITKKFLIAEEFDNNLTSGNRAFLKEHHQGEDKTVMEIAKYLDNMDKHIKTISVNSIESSHTLTELKEVENRITNQIQALTLLWQNKTIEQDSFNDMISNSVAEVNRISTTRARPSHTPNTSNAPNLSHRTNQPNTVNPSNQQRTLNVPFHNTQRSQNWNINQQPGNVNKFPAHWELNRYGAPYSCRRCGVKGHRDFNCNGTDKTCDECRQTGHIKRACPQRRTTQYQQTAHNQMTLN